MGWLSGLFGTKPKHYTRLEGDGDFECQVVGESNYQTALNTITGGRTEDGHEFECTALLEPEPSNPHDRNAITVKIDGRLVGYLSRAHAQALSVIFTKRNLAGAEASAIIVGGWAGRRGREDGHYGVRLDIPV